MDPSDPSDRASRALLCFVMRKCDTKKKSCIRYEWLPTLKKWRFTKKSQQKQRICLPSIIVVLMLHISNDRVNYEEESEKKNR